MCRTVADKLAAFFAFVNDDVAFFRIGDRRHRAKQPAAGVGTVAGIDIHVKRRKAKGAMIARAFSERQNLFAAILTDKSTVIF